MSDLQIVDRLHAEHCALLAAAGQLVAALRERPEAGLGELRGSCRMLAAQLRRHMHQEAQAVGGFARSLPRLNGWEMDRVSLEHHDEWRQLVILRLYTRSDGPFSLIDVRLMVGAFASRLEEQSVTQEARLFPLLRGGAAIAWSRGTGGNNGRSHG